MNTKLFYPGTGVYNPARVEFERTENPFSNALMYIKDIALFKLDTLSVWTHNFYPNNEANRNALRLFAEKGDCWGELGSPKLGKLGLDETIARNRTIDSARIAVRYEKLRVVDTDDGYYLVGDLLTANTEFGNLVHDYIFTGGKFRLCMRYYGTKKWPNSREITPFPHVTMDGVITFDIAIKPEDTDVDLHYERYSKAQCGIPTD